MHGPPLVGWLLVAVGTATGVYCLHRARSGGAGERGAARGDALMGLGMAAMAVPVATPAVARPWGAVLFAAVFGAAGLHALVLARRRADSHHLHHAVGAFAMVYMALAMTGTSATGHGGGHRPAGTPLLTGLLLVYFAVYVVRTLAAIVPVPAALPGEPAWRSRAATGAASATGASGASGTGGPSPVRGRAELTGACRVSMGIGMLAMLLTM
ncbi:DUF5134 domain-containing protein [Streptomyces sp. I05A-00742]|uniref:DUF5134 domain-containing protein n=1 Tax=Streptomyces sp. I05A-00742 TaxID=2732853 RepID=UPI001488B94D|nr:DUF5134 domain-containing protein [Streptomyces sp. I05A-00742]